jgi:hypothetical protein
MLFAWKLASWSGVPASPGWLVRRGAVSALPDVIEQVRRRLERESPAPSR